MMRLFRARLLNCLSCKSFSSTTHYPVLHRPLLNEMRSHFSHDDALLMLDCTLGGGGHAEKILKEFPNARLVGIDIDSEMLVIAKTKLDPFINKKQVALYHDNYTMFEDINFDLDLDLSAFKKKERRFNFILADLGFNSYQLSDPHRGFSYQLDGELDMRYDRTRNDTPTCADIVNSAAEYELTEIFTKFGEENYSRHLAKSIIKARKGRIIKTTKELNDIIWNAFRSTTNAQRYKIVTKAFQVPSRLKCRH